MIAIATPQLASMLAVLHLLALCVAVFAAPDNLQFSRISPAYRTRLVKAGSEFESWCLKHAEPVPVFVTNLPQLNKALITYIQMLYDSRRSHWWAPHTILAVQTLFREVKGHLRAAWSSRSSRCNL